MGTCSKCQVYLYVSTRSWISFAGLDEAEVEELEVLENQNHSS